MSELRKLFEQETGEQLERLQLLVDAAETKLSEFRMELREMFLNPGAEEKVAIIGKRAIHYYDQYQANVHEGVDDGINSIIDNFFTGTSEGVKEGFKSLIKIGLSTIFGNVTIGETQLHQYFIIPENNAFVRVDVKAWRYQFSSVGVIGKAHNAFCYVFCKSVVDHTQVTIDELIYLVSEMAGPNATLKSVKDLINAMRELWNDTDKKTADEVYNNYFISEKKSREAHRVQRREAARAAKSGNAHHITVIDPATKKLVSEAANGVFGPAQAGGTSSVPDAITLDDATSKELIQPDYLYTVNFTLAGTNATESREMYFAEVVGGSDLLFYSRKPSMARQKTAA
jgi:hypothetical protein